MHALKSSTCPRCERLRGQRSAQWLRAAAAGPSLLGLAAAATMSVKITNPMMSAEMDLPAADDFDDDDDESQLGAPAAIQVPASSAALDQGSASSGKVRICESVGAC